MKAKNGNKYQDPSQLNKFKVETTGEKNNNAKAFYNIISNTKKFFNIKKNEDEADNFIKKEEKCDIIGKKEAQKKNQSQEGSKNVNKKEIPMDNAVDENKQIY